MAVITYLRYIQSTLMYLLTIITVVLCAVSPYVHANPSEANPINANPLLWEKLSSQEKAYLQVHPKLSVNWNDNYPPFRFLDNGEKQTCKNGFLKLHNGPPQLRDAFEVAYYTKISNKISRLHTIQKSPYNETMPPQSPTQIPLPSEIIHLSNTPYHHAQEKTIPSNPPLNTHTHRHSPSPTQYRRHSLRPTRHRRRCVVEH